MMGPMLKRLLPVLILLLPCAARASFDDDWFDPAYLEANTMHGGTGFIDVPSPEVIPAGLAGASIHRYQVKLDYGLWDRLELGLTANLDGYNLEADGVRNQIFFGRLRLLDSESYGIGLSVGADGVGLEDLGAKRFGYLPKTSLENLQRVYAVAGGVLPFYQSLMLTLGWASGLGDGIPPSVIFNLSKVVLPGLLAMAEYDGQGTNLGARFLLSARVKLDLSLYHTQDLSTVQPFAAALERNIFFGITYSWPLLGKPGQD